MSSELIPSSTAGTLTSFDTALAAERQAESIMMRSITKSIVIGLPVGIGFFIVLLTLALAGEAEWYVIIGLGSLLGVLAAVMFGMLGGVTLVAHVLEDVDKGNPVGH